MKGYLLDENLPHGLLFQPSLPVIHATDLSSQPTDTQVWQYAAKNDLVIVTKDADFSDRMMISSPPPRVVHLRFGNMKRQSFHEFLARVWPIIENALTEAKLIAVYHDRIEMIS
jgi:predicted nuclease of predicted toxin-antitoxin system